MLPQILYYTKKELKGYDEPVIREKGNIYAISKEKLVKELQAIEKEIEYLSKRYVSVRDWQIKNFKYNGHMIFIDYGRYRVDFDAYESPTMILKRNKATLRTFLFMELMYLKACTLSEKVYQIYYVFVFLNENNALLPSDFIKENMKEEENLSAFINRLVLELK